MRAEAVRVCLNCGARNKVKWEFCARCAEALPPPGTGRPAAAEVSDSSATGFELGPVLIAAGVLAALIGGVFLLRGWVPQEADPALFAVPPPSQPVAKTPTRSVTAGQKALEDGRRLLGEGSFAAALARLESAVNERPDDPDAQHAYAKALYASGEQDAAIGHFRLAAGLAPSQLRFQSDLARTLDAMGRTEDAAKAYEDLLLTHPRDGEGMRLLAALRTKQGRPGDAVPLLRRLEEVRPGDLLVQQDLGYALEKAGELSAAATVYSEIVKEYPQGALARSRLAEVIYQQGQREQAIEIFRDGLQLTPNAPLLHRGLGNLLERSGQAEAAAREYREYARLAPNSSDARHFEERAARLESKVASTSTSS